MDKIGLIAGNKKLPLLFSQAAKQRGYYVVAVAIKGDTSPALIRYVDKVYWIGLSEFARMFEIFKSENITRLIMAGQVTPHRLFSKEIDRGGELKELLASIRDRRPDTIFGAIAERLKGAGFELIDSTTFIENLLPKKGTLTNREPDFREWEDIYFGLDLAKDIAFLDIGQTVAVKNKAIVAIEALEGTDNLIRRAGKITRGGFILVKVSKPKQDMRFDMPVVGLNTVKNLVKAKATCLAIEADKTIFIDKDLSIQFADKKRISVVAV
jgi:DUF1009 family protein